MSRSFKASSSLRLRLAPTLLALCLMGSPLMAADPVLSYNVATSANATLTVTWAQDVGGWDPLYQDITGLGASAGGPIGSLRVFKATAGTTTVPNPTLLLQPAVASGTATSTSSTTLVDSGAAWTVDQFAGCVVTGGAVTMTVVSNTATTLTGSAWSGATPSGTAAYSIAAGVAPVTLTSSMITGSTTKSITFSIPLGAYTKLYAAVPANVSYPATGGASPTLNSASPVSGTATQLVYTKVGTAVATGISVVSPANNSTSVSRFVPMTVSVNIDNDEAGANGVNINSLFSTADNFTVAVLDGATPVGSAIFHKTGIAWSGGAPTAQRQNIALALDGPLAVGVHTFNTTIKDPLNVTLTGGTATTKVLVWDRPTLQVNGKPVLPGATIVTDRINAYEFTGTKFNIGADGSTVTLTVGGVAATNANLTDPTKFKFTLPSLPASASNAVVLTQAYSGTGVTGSPTIVTNFVINNNAPDATAPSVPTISSPSDGSTVSSLTPVITGQGEIGATVQLRLTPTTGSVVTTSAATVGTDGFFSITSGLLVAGLSYSIEATSTDKAGNSTGWISLSQTLVTPLDVITPSFATATGITTQGGVNYSNTATATFTIPMTNLAGAVAGSTAVSGLAVTDIVVTGGAATSASTFATTGAATTFTVTPTGNGPVTINMPAGAYSLGGINSEAATQYTFIKDAAVPTYTVSVVNNGVTTNTATGVMGSGSFDVILTASEPLLSGNASNILIVSTGGTAGTFTKVGVLSADKLKYTVTCTVPTGTSNTGISITTSSAALTDLAGNVSAAVATAVTRTFDVTAPTMAGVTLTSAQAAVGKVAPLVFVTTFPEAVTGFDVGDFDVTNGVISSFVATSTSIYTLTVMPGEGPTPVKATIITGTVVADLAGNTLNTTSLFLNRTYDSTSPRVLAMTSSTPAPTSTDPKPTNLASIPCSITFSEPVTGMAAGVFQVENGSVSGFVQQTPSLYKFNVDVTPGAPLSKKVRVVLPAAAGVLTVKVLDAVGNPNSSVAVLVRNYDGVIPTLNYVTPTLSTTSATVRDAKGTFVIYVNSPTLLTTTDVATAAFDPSQLSVVGGTVDSIVGTSNAGKLTTITVTVTLPRGAGNVVTLSALPGVVTDAAGNQNASSSMQLIVPAND